jgi:hypothetical protein
MRIIMCSYCYNDEIRFVSWPIVLEGNPNWFYSYPFRIDYNNVLHILCNFPISSCEVSLPFRDIYLLGGERGKAPANPIVEMLFSQADYFQQLKSAQKYLIFFSYTYNHRVNAFCFLFISNT